MTPCRTKCAQVAAESAPYSAGLADYATNPPPPRGAPPLPGFTRETALSRHYSEGRFPTAPRIGVAAVVSELPERYRSAFILRYLKGLQPEQVATALGRSLEATRSDLNYAVNALREALSSSWRARARTR